MKARNPYQELDDRVREILRFERFYAPRLRAATRAAFVNEVNAAELGIFHELLKSPCRSAWLGWRLELDPGYLSRTLSRLQATGLVAVSRCADDGRGREWSLTEWGRAASRNASSTRCA